MEKYDAEKWQKKKDEERASYQKQIEESEVRLSALQKKGEHIATTKKEDSVTELNSEVENNVSRVGFSNLSLLNQSRMRLNSQYL